MRLLERQFSTPLNSFDDESRRYPFFQWLSRRKIAEEVVAEIEGLRPDQTSDAIDSIVRLMGYRWKSHDSYIQDFLSYAISARHWSLHIALSDDAKEVLLNGLRSGDFAAAVHEVAFEDLVIPIEEPDTQRMQLLAAVLAEREPEIRDILRTVYGWVDTSWTELYESLFSEKGWQLRPGLTFQDLNLMLSTAAEGMAIRGLIDQQGIIDIDRRRSLLGTLALAVMLACVDPGDGMTLEQAGQVFTSPEGPSTHGSTA